MNRSRTYLILCCFLSLTGSLFCQKARPLPIAVSLGDVFPFPESSVNDFAEDWNGFMWIATRDGLVRFDGTNLEMYGNSRSDSLIGAEVLDIEPDPLSKSLLLSTFEGLYLFDPASLHSRKISSIETDSSPVDDPVINWSFRDRFRNIWVSRRYRGLSKIDPQTFESKNYFFNVPGMDSILSADPSRQEGFFNEFNCIAEDSLRGVFWLGNYMGLTRFYPDEGRFLLEPVNHLAKDNVLANTGIHDILLHSNKLLIRTSTGLLVYDPDKGMIDPVPIHVPKSFGGTRKLLIHEQTIYLTFRRGMVTFDLNNLQQKDYYLDNESSNSYFGVSYIDSKGAYWIHSSDNLAYYNPVSANLTGFPFPANHSSPTTFVRQLSADELLVLGADPALNYVFNLRNYSWTAIKMNFQPDQPINWMDAVRMKDGSWYLIDLDKIYHYRPKENRIDRMPWVAGHLRDKLRCISSDGISTLWLGTTSLGLIRIDIPTGHIQISLEEFKVHEKDIRYSWITDLYYDSQDRLWIRLAQSYSIFFPKEGRYLHFYDHPGSTNSIRYVREFAEDSKGNVWMSARDGDIARTSRDSLAEGIRNWYIPANSYKVDGHHFFKKGRNDYFWSLNHDGLSRLNARTGEFNYYYYDDGLPHSQLLEPLEDGRVALAYAGGGIILFQPDRHPLSTLSIPYVKRVYSGEKVLFNSGNSIIPEILEMKPGTHSLSFEYSALGPVGLKEFAYRISEIDESWQYTRNIKSAVYTSLKPGNYRFTLKARPFGGDWGPETQWNIRLRPFWWQSAWFRLILSWSIILALFALYKSRTNYIKEQLRIRAEHQDQLRELEMQALRAQMNPHFLYNSLNSIQHFIIQNKTKSAVSYLDRFSRLVRLILQNSREKRVPLSDELEALKIYLDLEKLRFSDKFDYYIHIGEDINPNDVEIPPMLLQPFVENAILHGIVPLKTRGKIDLSVSSSGDELIFAIEDNGIGRAESQKLKNKGIQSSGRSMGLSITERRIALLNLAGLSNSQFEIIDLHSENGKARGTKIILRLSL